MTEETQEHAPESVETPEAVEDNQAPQWSPEDAEEARLFGWKSPDEWQGEKPSGYIDNPGEYLERVQRSRIFQAMEKKQDEQARKLAAVNDAALERQRADYETRLSEIKTRQERAVEEADIEGYRAAEQDRQKLQQPVPQQPAPEVAEFVQKNDWAKDPILFQEATEIVNRGLQSGLVRPNDTVAQLDFAERSMKLRYPHLFKSKDPAPVKQRVDGGGLAPGSSSRSAFDKLPPDAKRAFERFVQRGTFKDTKTDREEYAREYNNA